jgi:hypothetical protein
MTSSSLLEMGFRHFQVATIFTPYGGPACAGHRRPPRAVRALGRLQLDLSGPR